MGGHSYGRYRRVAKLVQVELAEALLQPTEDQWLHQLTIVNVDLTHDLSYARIYVAVPEGEEAAVAVKRLNGMAPHFRHRLAKNTHLRRLPKLGFYAQARVESDARVNALLDAIPDLPPSEDEETSAE